MLLLVASLHAFDGWASRRLLTPAAGRAWLTLSILAATLSFDEIGSLHERLPDWWSVLPFALVFAAMFSYATFVLIRSEEHRKQGLLVGGAFLLLSSIALQEEIQFRVDWPWFLIGIRAVVEEGTELLATILLVRASIGNTRGILSAGTISHWPVFEATSSLRVILLTGGIVAAPVLAYLTANLEAGLYENGVPTDWPTAALFLLAAVGALRHFLTSGDSPGRCGWALASLGVIGCASTVLDGDSSVTLPVMGALAAVAGLLWVIDDRYRATLYLPVLIFIIACVAVAWVYDADTLIRAWMTQYIALGFYD